MPCAFTKGAPDSTSLFCFACASTPRQSARRSAGPLISRCAATPRMRVRSSSWKPFITESTTMSAITPSAIPAMETMEMKEMKWLRRLAWV